MMDANHIKALLRREPFQPFQIRLADGRAVDVEHPEMIMFSPSGLEAIVYQPDSTFSIVNLELATELEPRRNGRGRRRGVQA